MAEKRYIADGVRVQFLIAQLREKGIIRDLEDLRVLLALYTRSTGQSGHTTNAWPLGGLSANLGEPATKVQAILEHFRDSQLVKQDGEDWVLTKDGREILQAAGLT